MHLTEQEAKRFYNIWFPLLNYVNEKRNLSPTFAESWHNQNVNPQDAVILRDALWEDDTLREGFIAENPHNLSAVDLALVESWKHRVNDSFFIAHYLKSHAIFITGKLAYGVWGITNSIEEMTDGQTPVYVKTVLIPFENRIIYDSLIAPYPVVFGGGYKKSLKDTYRAIQERGGVITQLPHNSIPTIDIVQQSNKKVLKAFSRELGKAGLSPQKMTEHIQSITDLADKFLLKQTPPEFLLDITPALLTRYAQTSKTKINWVSIKRYARFLRDTYRQDWNDAENLLDAVKRHQASKKK